MAIVSFTGYIEDPPAPNQISAGPTFGTTVLQIDAAGERGGVAIFRSPETCDIRKVGFGVRTVTTGATVEPRLETVSDTDGFPTGTLVGSNTNGSQVILSTDDLGYFITQLTADASVIEGQKIGLVVVNPAVSPGNMQLACFGDEHADFPYSALFTSSWNMVSGSRPMAYFEKSDGSALYVPGVLPMSNSATVIFNSSTNPNHRALRSRRPYPAQVCGFWWWGDLDGDADMLLVNPDWDGTNGDALAMLSMDKDVEAVTAGGIHHQFFPSDQWPTVAANAFTRLVVKPTTGTSLSTYDMLVANATAMNAASGGSNYHLSTANNPTQDSDWTQTLTRRPFMGLLLNGFDDGTGSGGGPVGYTRAKRVN